MFNKLSYRLPTSSSSSGNSPYFDHYWRFDTFFWTLLSKIPPVILCMQDPVQCSHKSVFHYQRDSHSQQGLVYWFKTQQHLFCNTVYMVLHLMLTRVRKCDSVMVDFYCNTQEILRYTWYMHSMYGYYYRMADVSYCLLLNRYHQSNPHNLKNRNHYNHKHAASIIHSFAGLRGWKT